MPHLFFTNLFACGFRYYQKMRISLEYFEDEVIWPYLAEEEKPAKLDGDDEKRWEQVIAMGSDQNPEIGLVRQDMWGM